MLNSGASSLTPSSAEASWYGDRGTLAGGYTTGTDYNIIDYWNITSAGNASDFGDLSDTREDLAACSNGSKGYYFTGWDYNTGGNAGYTDVIEYITFASTGNATSHGTLGTPRQNLGGCSDGTTGLCGGGHDHTTGFGGAVGEIIDYLTLSTTGNASDFGDLTVARGGCGCVSDGTKGVWAGGHSGSYSNIIDYVTIATTGNATDFGDLINTGYGGAGTANKTRGIFAGFYTYNNIIQYITIASTGNASDFGDKINNTAWIGSTGNGTTGQFMGGSAGWSNVIQSVTIASTGNASDFGDLTQARASCNSGTSGN